MYDYTAAEGLCLTKEYTQQMRENFLPLKPSRVHDTCGNHGKPLSLCG